MQSTKEGKEEIGFPHFNTVSNPQPLPLPLRREAGAAVPMATNGPHCSQASPHSLLTKTHTHTHTHSATQAINTFEVRIHTGEKGLNVRLSPGYSQFFRDQQEAHGSLIVAAFTP